jgi:hypothetical protein
MGYSFWMQDNHDRVVRPSRRALTIADGDAARAKVDERYQSYNHNVEMAELTGGLCFLEAVRLGGRDANVSATGGMRRAAVASTPADRRDTGRRWQGASRAGMR